MIDQGEFAIAALAIDKDAFILHVTYLWAKMSIHPAQETQIDLLLAKKVSFLKEYTDFSNVFCKELAAVLLKRSDINEHVIDLEPNK